MSWIKPVNKLDIGKELKKFLPLALGILSLVMMLTVSAVFFPEEVHASSNADLKEIIVKGGNLRPSFKKDTLLYAIDVSREVTEVEVYGVPEDPEATVESPGLVEGLEFEKTLKKKIIVTSADGTVTKTYTLYITRYDKVITPKPADESPEPTGTLQSTVSAGADETADPSVSDKPSDSSETEETDPEESDDSKPSSGPGIRKVSNDKDIPASGLSSGDLAICTVLAFLSGILIGYAVFFFAER